MQQKKIAKLIHFCDLIVLHGEYAKIQNEISKPERFLFSLLKNLMNVIVNPNLWYYSPMNNIT